jgi:16S rRNA (guanine966-N2)-methyltransferase
MRIIAGAWRGRTIKSPTGEHVRPTRDRIRQAWLNIVQPKLPGATVADLCAGSGALGLEALSRGATHADFVDSDPRSIALIKDNIATLSAASQSTVHKSDAVQFVQTLPEQSFDIVFADPPYASDVAVRLAQAWLKTPYAALLCIEHDSRDTLPDSTDVRRYGSSAITFYHAQSRHLRG